VIPQTGPENANNDYLHLYINIFYYLIQIVLTRATLYDTMNPWQRLALRLSVGWKVPLPQTCPAGMEPLRISRFERSTRRKPRFVQAPAKPDWLLGKGEPEDCRRKYGINRPVRHQYPTAFIPCTLQAGFRFFITLFYAEE
jgi:hypothetical protein